MTPCCDVLPEKGAKVVIAAKPAIAPKINTWRQKAKGFRSRECSLHERGGSTREKWVASTKKVKISSFGSVPSPRGSKKQKSS